MKCGDMSTGCGCVYVFCFKSGSLWSDGLISDVVLGCLADHFPASAAAETEHVTSTSREHRGLQSRCTASTAISQTA